MHSLLFLLEINWLNFDEEKFSMLRLEKRLIENINFTSEHLHYGLLLTFLPDVSYPFQYPTSTTHKRCYCHNKASIEHQWPYILRHFKESTSSEDD